MKKKFLAILAMVVASVSAMAQQIADKELVGVWLMGSYFYDGEKVIQCGKDYAQFKYYGADGEYACAEIALTKDGKAVVMPHEYGKYTFKNGVYSEMGRPAVPRENMKLVSATEFHGKWKNRNDVWKKCTTMPQNVVRYIVDKCKAAQPVPEMDALVKKHCFK